MVMEDLELEQLDVKIAFFHEDLDEDIYMSQWVGFMEMWEQGHLMCNLKKSLYGLKQAPRMWLFFLSSRVIAFFWALIVSFFFLPLYFFLYAYVCFLPSLSLLLF